MAGGGSEHGENPVEINVVPMVDVIFCLCIFFMCSFKIKLVEGKFDSWLPRDKGLGAAPTDLQEIRILLTWNESTQLTERQLGYRKIRDDSELQDLVREAHADHVKQGKPDLPVTVDADPNVPWNDVMNVINLCKREDIEKIEFAFGTGKI